MQLDDKVNVGGVPSDRIPDVLSWVFARVELWAADILLPQRHTEELAFL